MKGIYPLRSSASGEGRVQLLGSGTILREVLAAADLLKEDFSIEADVWSVTSYSELARDAAEAERWSMLHPGEDTRKSYLARQLEDRSGPVVAASDYVRAQVDQIAPYLPGRQVRVLGTDGWGRSDTREKLRHFFEVDRFFIVVAALSALAEEGQVEATVVSEAIAKYNLDSEKPSPFSV